MLDPFKADAFSTIALSLSIQKFPPMFGQLADLNVFPDEGVRLRNIMIEEWDHVLTLLPTATLGSPGTSGRIGKRIARSFVIPHIPHDDVILPEEVQGIRAFGSENTEMALADLMGRKLQGMRLKHDITREHLRIGALNGHILDADGTTVIYNVFTEFGIAEPQEDFNFTDDTLDVRGLCLNVKRYMELHIGGEVMDGVMCLCSPGFYDSLTKHPTVKQAFQYFTTTQQLSGDYRKGFVYAGIEFREYLARAAAPSGSLVKFIADNEARFFPTGTKMTGRTFNAPADFNETVNTIGLPFYAKQKPRDYDRGWDVHTQSNPLPLWARPKLLVKGTIANSTFVDLTDITP